MSKSSMMIVVLLLVHSSSTAQPLGPDQQSDEVTYDLGNCHKIIKKFHHVAKFHFALTEAGVRVPARLNSQYFI